MQTDWQNIVALALVALATVYVAWRVWGMIRGGGGCGSTSGGCNTCSQNQPLGGEKGGLPLVELKPNLGPVEHDKPRI